MSKAADKETARLLEQVRNNIARLRVWIEDATEAVNRHENGHQGERFSQEWGNEIMKVARVICNSIAEYNGAVKMLHLIRAAESSEKTKGETEASGVAQ